MINRTLVVAAIILAAGWLAGPSAQAGRKYFNPRTPADATAPPYSGSVLAGDTLYLSGTIGLDQDQKVPDAVDTEAKNVLTNVENMLKAAGMTMDDLVSVQVFCSDVAHYDAFNKVYRTFFKKEFPPRAFVGSGRLLFGARFEVQGIAVKR